MCRKAQESSQYVLTKYRKAFLSRVPRYFTASEIFSCLVFLNNLVEVSLSLFERNYGSKEVEDVLSLLRHQKSSVSLVKVQAESLKQCADMTKTNARWKIEEHRTEVTETSRTFDFMVTSRVHFSTN